MKSVNGGGFISACIVLIAGTTACAEHAFQGYQGQALQAAEVATIEVRRPTVLYSVNGNTAHRSKGDGMTIGEVLPGKTRFHLGVVNLVSSAVSSRLDCGTIEVDLAASMRYAIVALGEINTIPAANNSCVIRVIELLYDSEKGKYVPNGTTVPHALVGAR